MQKVKIAALLVLFVGTLVIGFLAWQKIVMLTQENATLRQQTSQANLELGIAQTRLGDANKQIARLGEELQREIKARNELAQRYTELWVQYQNSGSTVVTPPNTGSTVHTDSPVFVPGNLYLAFTEDLLLEYQLPLQFPGVQHRSLKIDATLTSDSSGLSLKIDHDLDLRLALKLIDTIDPQGVKNTYGEVWEVDKEGKPVEKLKISRFETIVEDQRVPAFRWTFHLDISAFLGWQGRVATGASLGVSVAGYGLTDNDLGYRFGRIGVSLGETVGVDFAPILWNAGGPIPLMSNLWIAPYLSFNGVFGGGAMVGVVL